MSSKAAWQAFIDSGLLNPLDWERFYAFVLATHQEGASTVAADVRQMVLEVVKNDQLAANLGWTYDRLRDFVRFLDTQGRLSIETTN